MVTSIRISLRFWFWEMMFSFVSGGYWELRMRFSDSPYNSDSSDMLDVLPLRSWDITRKSTWIFEIWLRFVKYGSSLSCEWNLHENDRVVVILEQFEVQTSKTLPPPHFQKKSPTHRGFSEGLEGSDQNTVLIKSKFRWIGGTLVGIVSRKSAENASGKS